MPKIDDKYVFELFTRILIGIIMTSPFILMFIASTNQEAFIDKSFFASLGRMGFSVLGIGFMFILTNNKITQITIYVVVFCLIIVMLFLLLTHLEKLNLPLSPYW